MGQDLNREELCKGEWDADLDKYPEKEYLFVSNGYNCSISRNCRWNYCGYVDLPPNHPDFSKTYQDLEKIISVHGGLTYGNCDGSFGFDTCHMGDLSPVGVTLKSKYPEMILHFPPTTYHYWTFEEVKTEVENMAKQFKSREG